MEQLGSRPQIISLPVGEIQRSDAAMITSREYRQFARESTKWAVETETAEDRKSFLALAKDWTFAAMATVALPRDTSQ
jgi:hypothetical protein